MMANPRIIHIFSRDEWLAAVRAMPSEWRRLPISPYRAYEVSADGRIRRNGRELKPHVDRYGYRTIQLSYAGLARHFKVSRLVCETFNGPCPDERECAHMDGDKTNNTASNLAWVSHAENNDHKRLHGTHQAGEKHPRARLTAEQVATIRATEGVASRKLAAQYGVNQSQIVRIKNGDRWAEPSSTVSAVPVSPAIAGGGK